MTARTMSICRASLMQGLEHVGGSRCRRGSGEGEQAGSYVVVGGRKRGVERDTAAIEREGVCEVATCLQGVGVAVRYVGRVRLQPRCRAHVGQRAPAVAARLKVETKVVVGLAEGRLCADSALVQLRCLPSPPCPREKGA